MNSYQRRLGLVFGAAALLTLLLSSGAQSTIGYAQFANAYSQVAKACPNFPNPVSILLGNIQPLDNRNITNTDYEFHTYVKHFSLSGLWLNNTSIGFAHLQATVFSTQTWFWPPKNHTKSSETNSTINVSIDNFAAKILQHEAIITAKHGEGNYTTISLQWPALTVKLSGDNLKGTVSCGVT